MPIARDFGPLDVTDFTVGAMLRAGIAIRRAVRGADSLEAAAELITRYLFENCADPDTGERSCALVRFYATLPFGSLDAGLREFAAAQLDGEAPGSTLRCLTLIATAGEEPAWNSRLQSRGHRTIALPSAEAIRATPMILRLFEDLGLDIEALVSGHAPVVRSGESRTYDVFHVEEASGSPFIPAQREFVEPFGIRSVVGFGGLLRSGELFSVILFSRRAIPAASAARFRTIALDVRSALFMVDENKLWRA